MSADEDTAVAVAVEVVPGPAGDAPRLGPMLKTTLAAGPVDELVADTAFDGDRQREACLEAGVLPVIKNHPSRKEPWEFDAEIYRERNKAERLFAKVKQFRPVATRYEKLKSTYTGFLHLAFGFLRLRKLASNVNTA